MRHVRRTTTPEVRLDLAPLIDVVFLLLTFFIFAMLLMVRADVLEIQLPKIAAGTPAEPGEPITVALTQQSKIQIAGEDIELTALADRITQIRDQRDSPALPVLLAVDERCDSGTLIRVIDAMTGAGISDFAVMGTPADLLEPQSPETSQETSALETPQP